MKHEVAIIGAGPAGLAAAIQLRRYGIEALLFEQDQPGGLLLNANLVENYPGFPNGIRGSNLVKLFLQQAERAGVVITFERVEALRIDGSTFILETSRTSYQAEIVVIASGTRANNLTDVIIDSQAQDRVVYEIYPLVGLQGNRIAIIGAGDAAFDYALNLAKRNQVLVLNRSQARKCLPLLWERSLKASNIAYRENVIVEMVKSTQERKLLLSCQNPSGEEKIMVDYLVGAIGRRPQLGFLTGEVKAKLPELAGEGKLHVIGDAGNDIYRQTSIAVGQGILASMQINHKLEES